MTFWNISHRSKCSSILTIMIGYFKLLFNCLYNFIIFSGYVWKRLFRIIKEYLRQLCGLSIPECYYQPDSAWSSSHVKPLENKTLSYVTGIFSPILIELKLYNGIVSGLNLLASKHLITIDQNFKTKTVTPVEELDIIYDGSLKCMSTEFPFFINVELKNMKIFTELNVTPYGSQSIVNELHIDDIKLELDICNCILRNASDNFVISAVLKLVSFFILCLLELLILFNLKSKFSSSDFINIYPDHTLKNSVRNYLIVTKNKGYRFYPAKSFICVLNNALVEINRKFLDQNFSGTLFSNHIAGSSQVQMEDERWVQNKDVCKLMYFGKPVSNFIRTNR